VVSPSRIFLRNWTLKLSALVLALLLWIAVRVEAPNRQELSGVPIRVDLADPGWALVDPPNPTTVRVRFGGPSRELMRLAMDRPSLVIPVDHVSTSDTVVFLRSQWVRVQDRTGVVVEDIQPAAVRLSFEPLERIALPPAVRLQGELPGDVALSGPPLAAPSEIRVSGPRGRILALDSVPLRPVDLSLVASSGAQTVEVQTEGMEGLQFQPMAVEVRFQVEDRIERMVSGVPVSLGDGNEPPNSPMGDLRVAPLTGAVRLSGARSLLERMDPTLLRLVVDPGGRAWPEPGEEGRFPIRLEGLPPLVEGVPDPEEASVQRVAGEGGEADVPADDATGGEEGDPDGDPPPGPAQGRGGRP
jgi:hypothetical protein